MFLPNRPQRFAVIFACFVLARYITTSLNPEGSKTPSDETPGRFTPLATRRLRVTFLDVGKGDAIVVETPSGKTLVVDTGATLPNGDDQGKRTIAPFLRERGIRRIDALLLTHPHLDHIGGTVSLLNEFPVGRLYDNGFGASSPGVKRYRQAAKDKRVLLTSCGAGSR